MLQCAGWSPTHPGFCKFSTTTPQCATTPWLSLFRHSQFRGFSKFKPHTLYFIWTPVKENLKLFRKWIYFWKRRLLYCLDWIQFCVITNMLSKRGCFLLDGDSGLFWGTENIALEQVKAALVTSIHISTLAPPPASFSGEQLWLWVCHCHIPTIPWSTNAPWRCRDTNRVAIWKCHQLTYQPMHACNGDRC